MRQERPPRGVLDTSIFVALENGRRLNRDGLPKQNAISIVTSAELRAGILVADDIATRNRRLATWEASRRFSILPIDPEVDSTWAQMCAYLAAADRRVNANDMWIAATAAAHEIPVVTQDSDFDALNGVAGLTVVPV
jgi:predicted nucleic acid-binding protein